MALLMFPKLFYWDRTLWETALSLDQRIKPNDLLYPKRLTLYDEIYIGHTPTRMKQNLYKKACIYRYRSGFKGPLSILDGHKRVLAERALSHFVF
jgi:serine/threonine protein phosphatase 1